MEALRIAELPACERPRERLFDGGPRGLATAELLAILLGSGQANGLSAIGLAQRLLRSLEGPGCDPLAHLRDISAAELMLQPGIGPARAASLLAALELGRRVFLAPPAPRPVVDSPQAVAAVLRAEMAFARQEQFAVLLLDIKNRLIAHRIVTLGTLDETLAHPREIFREAIRQAAAGIIVAHNHPSGITDPSAEDLRLTRQLLECARTLQIPVLDHVIVAQHSCTSLRRTTALWQS
ncbi:RadC family protein [Gloeobacter kilaueensis]|uniref:DNA repair protein RadC n=1 Tax=Gloeobacter kilaueensis (strain ATCC BAA-2537 / CCAP 1431/1 / ULC 316 / JS1) TaxID=1183438 RepID=U5QKW2_GLOK1|nr:DNA repair protein RadC [Gloeobacter kilaueensis]AGY58254.1 DNA repair protein RadC [Gloeobacter kilaueensis JS1]